MFKSSLCRSRDSIHIRVTIIGKTDIIGTRTGRSIKNTSTKRRNRRISEYGKIITIRGGSRSRSRRSGRSGSTRSTLDYILRKMNESLKGRERRSVKIEVRCLMVLISIGRKVNIGMGGSCKRIKGTISEYVITIRWGSRSSRDSSLRKMTGDLKGRRTGKSTGMIIKPVKITGTSLSNPTGTSNSNDHEGTLNSTCRFSYRIGTHRAEEIIDPARARTVRLM
jgi:hypothetical protein